MGRKLDAGERRKGTEGLAFEFIASFLDNNQTLLLLAFDYEMLCSA